jgi:enoyl-CoA hydratase
MNKYTTLSCDTANGIATIKINRPEAMNALNSTVLQELRELLDYIDYDNEVRAAIITGEGKAFVAGADVGAMAEQDVISSRSFTALGHGVMDKIERMEKIVVAAVNGFALGGGCELAMACDLRFASENARFGLPEVGLGIIPGFGGTQRLPRLVGEGNAKYLIYSADVISAAEAYRIGLVQKVFPPEELLAKTGEYVERVMAKAPIAVRLAKVAVTRGANMDKRSAIDFEGEALATTLASEDRVEGFAAFMEKRPPKFKNK